MHDSPRPAPSEPSFPVEVSVIMPCLNEEDTVGACVEQAMRAFRESGIQGEVIIADNGSTDRSAEIARRCGARIERVAAPGYGNALKGGIASARGRYIVMGDADQSYDFSVLEPFIARLRSGAELVQGCRLPSGGGRVLPGAMPWSHRWIGNPMFSTLVRLWFGAPIHDVYCGYRAFSRELYDRLDLQCDGMEFAVEMVIKASLIKARIGEVAITLHPDGRKSHPPHLRTFRDGWRTLRFFLLYCPRWLFIRPGLLMMAAGLAGYGIAMPGLRIAGLRFDAHTLLFASLALILGTQAFSFGIIAKVVAAIEGILPVDARLKRLRAALTLERCLLTTGLGFLAGTALLGMAVFQWWRAGFGDLDYQSTMRWVIPGATLCTLSFQLMLTAFLLSIVEFRLKPARSQTW